MVISGHWNGPPGSANGGYTCGVVAGLLEAPSAEVSLRAPPPLDTELTVERDEESARLMDGSTVVAEGRAAPPPDAEPPRTVSLDEAEAASRAGLERWAANHPFPTCVVCGPERDDGFGVFPGVARGLAVRRPLARPGRRRAGLGGAGLPELGAHRALRRGPADRARSAARGHRPAPARRRGAGRRVVADRDRGPQARGRLGAASPATVP